MASASRVSLTLSKSVPTVSKKGLTMNRVCWIFLLLFLCCGRSAMCQSPKGTTLEYQWDTVLPVWIKLNSDFEYSNSSDEAYLQLMQPETWKEVKANEFKVRAAKKQARERLTELVSGTDVSKSFVLLNANVSLGEYDFELEGFPIKQMADTVYWTTGSRYSNGLPTSFSVFFTNTKPFALIKMAPEAAEKLLATRTDRFGAIDRNATAEIEFQFTGLREKKSTELNATIQKVVVYNDRNKLKMIARLDGTPSPDKKDDK